MENPSRLQLHDDDMLYAFNMDMSRKNFVSSADNYLQSGEKFDVTKCNTRSSERDYCLKIG